MTAIWIRMGTRNLIKNGRRSLFILLTIALGYAGINLFSAFVRYTFVTLEDGFVYAYGHGHLVILAGSTPPSTPFLPMDHIFEPETLEKIFEVCSSHPDVTFHTPVLLISGVINTESSSSIFWATGVLPNDMAHIRNQAKTKVRELELFEGQELNADTLPGGIAVSRGLAGKLDLNLGDPVILLSTTVEGQMNALDAEILQILDVYELLSDMFLSVPLPLARELLDTRGADRVIIMLQHQDQVDRVRDELRTALDALDLEPMQIRTWKEMLTSYYRMRRTFDFVFRFLFCIIFPIVGINIMNMVGLTVIERTREIGTLRALGLKRRDVRHLFANECMILAVSGIALGAFLCVAIKELIKAFGVEWNPPFVPHSLPLELILNPSAMFSSMMLFLFFVLLSSWIPANRAAQKNIVEALGHV